MERKKFVLNETSIKIIPKKKEEIELLDKITDAMEKSAGEFIDTTTDKLVMAVAEESVNIAMKSLEKMLNKK